MDPVRPGKMFQSPPNDAFKRRIEPPCSYADCFTFTCSRSELFLFESSPVLTSSSASASAIRCCLGMGPASAGIGCDCV